MTLRSLTAALSAAVVALVAPSTVGAVSVGTSGWSWGSPTPTAAPLLDVSFSGTTGYAVGQSGTMMKSTDGGQTWTGLRTGVSGPFLEVQTVSPEIVTAGGGCSALLSTNGGTSFTRLYFTSTTCSQEFAGAAFLNGTTGYLALENGTFVQTTDGGATWIPKTAIPGAQPANGSGFAAGIWAVNATTVLAIQAGTAGSKIYRTTDSGGSWTEVASNSQAIEDIAMVDANNGFAVGNAGILATTDGGATWTVRNPNGQAQNVAAFSATQAIFVGPTEGGSVILRTTDGGTTLSNGVSTGVNPVQAAAYTSATGVVVVGEGAGGVAVSSDGGATFPASAGGDTIKASLGRLRFAPGGAVATGSGGALARTTNGGVSWSQIGVPTSEDIKDVNFPSGTIGYAIDTAGKLFKTTNNATSWANIDTGSTAKPNAIAASGSSTVMLIGPTGVRRSTNGASSFSTVKGTVASQKLTDYDKGGSAFFTWGSSALLRSTNGGSSWSKLKLPSSKTKISQVDFATSSTGYLRDTSGRVYRTSNTGSSWSQLTTVGTSTLSGMSFSSSTTGFLVTSRFGQTPDSAYLLRTTNSGKTWAPQLVWGDPVNTNGLLAGSTSYLLAGNGLLLYSTSGGVSGSSSSVSVKPSSTKLKKKTKIRVTITVKGAKQGDIAVVASQASGGSWTQQQVALDSTGKATTSWTVSKTTTYVGQWTGNENVAGAGSSGAKVTVGS